MCANISKVRAGERKRLVFS